LKKLTTLGVETSVRGSQSPTPPHMIAGAELAGRRRRAAGYMNTTREALRDTSRSHRPFVERRSARPGGHGEAWSYQLNGTTRRVTVSVVIPARNEAANLPALFAGLPAVYEVILVDGNSVDGTVETAKALLPQVNVVTQRGRGKGQAMVEGLAAATGDITVFIDADGSNRTSEVEDFVLALVNGADLAKGSRFLQSAGSVDITGIRRLGNACIRGVVNRVYGTRFTDIAYGYNALWTRHRDVLGLDCQGFEVETLLHIRAARAGLTIQEVPSFEGKRHIGASNLHAARDGVRIAAVLVRELADQHINGRHLSAK
jgi:glycosyltransferase involved in cell wall biosynthesis